MVDTGSGLEPLDFGALDTEQRTKLVEFKIDTRIDNEKYLRSHKEVELLLSGFLRQLFFKTPKGHPNYDNFLLYHPDVAELCVIPANARERRREEHWANATGEVEVLMQRPDNIREFAADYFTDPELPKRVQQQLMEKMNEAQG